jgi:hypothetical protein
MGAYDLGGRFHESVIDGITVKNDSLLASARKEVKI